MRIEPSGSTYFASLPGNGTAFATYGFSGGASIWSAAETDAAENADNKPHANHAAMENLFMPILSVQFRELACQLRRVERQVSLGIQSDGLLAFLRQDHGQILLDERIDRLAGETADVDVEETVERIAAAQHVFPRADHGLAPVAGGDSDHLHLGRDAIERRDTDARGVLAHLAGHIGIGRLHFVVARVVAKAPLVAKEVDAKARVFGGIVVGLRQPVAANLPIAELAFYTRLLPKHDVGCATA